MNYTPEQKRAAKKRGIILRNREDIRAEALATVKALEAFEWPDADWRFAEVQPDPFDRGWVTLRFVCDVADYQQERYVNITGMGEHVISRAIADLDAWARDLVDPRCSCCGQSIQYLKDAMLEKRA